MATGFVQRWKGRVTADAFSVKGLPMYGREATQTISLVSSSLGASTIVGSFLNILSSGSTTAGIARLRKPLFAGNELTLMLSSGSGLYLTASTDGSITINGTTCSVISSTIAGTTHYTLSLVATSTANWAVVGAYPGINTSTGGPIWILSTST